MHCLPFLTDAPVVSGVVRIGMTDSTGADALHYIGVISPMQRPCAEMVIRWIVDHAKLSTTLRFVVGFEEGWHDYESVVAGVSLISTKLISSIQ